jgi:heme A synthase
MGGDLYMEGDQEGFLGWGMLNVFAMDWIFAVHRYLPFVILGWMIWLMRKEANKGNVSASVLSLDNPLMVIAVLCALQIGIGVVHIWFVVPAWAQVSHVVVGSAIITYIFAVYLSARAKKSISVDEPNH